MQQTDEKINVIIMMLGVEATTSPDVFVITIIIPFVNRFWHSFVRIGESIVARRAFFNFHIFVPFVSFVK